MMEKFSIPKESLPGATHTFEHNEIKGDVYKLIHLTQELPSTPVAISEYETILDDTCWTDANDKRITPRHVVEVYKSMGLEDAVRAHPELAEHLQSMHQADYSHPILMYESNIIDGMHRFAKAYADGQSVISAKLLTEIPTAALINKHES